MVDTNILLIFILILSTFLGFEIISKVPSTLHTPLMSGSNAISGITLVGAVLAAGRSDGELAFMTQENVAAILGMAAVIFATINVVGGYLVTDRMLKMFKSNRK